MAQGIRYRAQGKNNQRILILSLYLAPCTSWTGKAIEIGPGPQDQVFFAQRKIEKALLV
jgi:hypothetical protein